MIHLSETNVCQVNEILTSNPIISFLFLSVELTEILFILKYLKSPDGINESVSERIHFIFETNPRLRTTVYNYLTEKNSSISPDEYPLIRDILFRYYNEFLLHNINCQQYLSRMLTYLNEQTIDYLILWFKHFLCESNPKWMNYQNLLRQWTDCLFSKQHFFSQTIKQMDVLIDMWNNAALEDHQRSHFFIEHMASRCFHQSNVSSLISKCSDLIIVEFVYINTS